jgi:uncharacterized protein (TIGR00304 family)
MVGAYMRPRVLVPIVLFVGGIALISLAVASGEADVSLFLIFPVFSGSSALFVLGTVLILLSFVAGFAFLALGQHELVVSSLPWADKTAGGGEPQTKTKYGGVVLIGPIPVAFGSDKKIAWTMLAVGIAVAVALLVLILLSL